MQDWRADIMKGYQQITNLSSATALTIPAGSASAIFVPETQNVRWRDDGTDPTATVGMLLSVGQSLTYTGDALGKLTFIETAASAKLNIAYYG